MGDSHTAIFSDPEFRSFVSKNYICCLETVGGATISGLTNPNSKTNAQALFENAFQQIQPDVLVTQLGEVDTGFVIWYRAEKYRTSVTKMLETCIKNYKEFLTRYKAKEKTVVISAPLPTIRDDQDWGEIANLRREITATQKERTALTIEFNTRMSLLAKEIDVIHINLDNESMGADGLVAEFLLNDDVNDHHYSRQTYLQMLMKHLKVVL